MPTNGKPGDGHRIGAVKKRPQTFNPQTQQWVSDVKQGAMPFKGVGKERKK